MARPLRIERAGGWYHVTARGNERKAICREARDWHHFLELLGEMVEQFRVRVHAYVLMNNHYHLMMELREANLSRAVQWLNVSYSVWHNRRHGRSGHLFQGRFKSVVLSREGWGLELSRYLHLNPVRVEGLGMGKTERQRSREGGNDQPTAELVRRRIGVLRRYRWSSYRAYIGLEAGPPWLERQEVLRLGGGAAKGRRQRYREYVETAVREGLKISPWESVLDQVVLGSQEFLEKLKRSMEGGSKAERKRAGELSQRRPSWADVLKSVEQMKGEEWATFRDRHGDRGRDLALYAARRWGGLTLSELAQRGGLKGATAAAMAVKR